MKKTTVKIGAIWLVVIMVASVFLVVIPSNASAENFAGGDGTEEDPYQISTVEHLQNMRLLLGGHYILIDDIDASDTVDWNEGAGFIPVGDGESAFVGSFNGKGYVITDLCINRISTNYVGLFGYLYNGYIANVGLEDIEIDGNQDVGGLVGRNYGSIENCFTTGSVSATNSLSRVGGLAGTNSDLIINSFSTCDVNGYQTTGGLVGAQWGASISSSYATGSVSGSVGVGGLVGYNNPNSIISNSYATGSVNGPNADGIGGLVGGNTGAITNSYATGSVSGVTYVGGLSGVNDGTVTYSYSTGFVIGTTMVGGLIGRNYYGSTSYSYWDIQTSGQFSSPGGIGKTTAQMKQQNTFSGWDFINVWNIIDTVTYPYLLYPPVAKAGNDFTVDVDEVVNFNGINSYASFGGTLVSYDWEFDDGNSGSGVTPTHSYDTSGTYTVTLIVIDNEGLTDSDTITITVITPEEATEDFITFVEDLDLPDGLEESLTSKLDGAISALKKGQDIAAINKLDAFINQVEAQRGKKIAEDDADALVATAEWIIDNI